MSLAASPLGGANGSAMPICKSWGAPPVAAPPEPPDAAPPGVFLQPSQPAPSAPASSVAYRIRTSRMLNIVTNPRARLSRNGTGLPNIGMTSPRRLRPVQPRQLGPLQDQGADAVQVGLAQHAHRARLALVGDAQLLCRGGA